MLQILEYEEGTLKMLHKEVLPFEKYIQPTWYQWTLDCVLIAKASASDLAFYKLQTSLQLSCWEMGESPCWESFNSLLPYLKKHF